MLMKIDFEALLAEVKVGAKKAFQACRENADGKTIFGYALYSDDSAMTICHMCGTRELLAGRTDEPEVRWICHEWDLQAGGGNLDKANERINAEDAFDRDSDADFIRFRDGVYATCVRAMDELIAEGFFGGEKERDGMFLTFAVSDPDDMMREIRWSRRLNTPSVLRSYDNWVRSWAEAGG